MIDIDVGQWSYAQVPQSAVVAAASDPYFSPEPSCLEGVQWVECKAFPTEIHWELRERGDIPDWNKGFAEHEVQWVSERYWAFQTTITLDGAALENKHAELEFESLDTFATVYLNGKEILKADNHFLAHKVPVAVSSLKPTNHLLIIFTPAEPIANALNAQHGPFKGGSCNLGNRSRMGIRKSQYHFRWDWGPELKCVGPDRPIRLRLFNSRLGRVTTLATVNENLDRLLKVDAELDGGEGCEVVVTLNKLDGTVIKSYQGGKVDWKLGREVELWWPLGHGEPTRYEVVVELLKASTQSTQDFQYDGKSVDILSRRIGFRRVELVQRALDDQDGSSFFFQINNKPIYAGGSNWIPIDMTLPTSEGRYRRWLELMVRGNQNMIRVWGGGVYEPECFYTLCDEMGIMVWQDFMFACGVYPVFQHFLDNVQKEAEYNVERLRNHPSMTLFCGNNEDYQMILQWNMDQSGDPLPARKIYEKLLPDVVGRLTEGSVPYHRGSPYGGKGWDTADPTIGDVHQWEVWAGRSDYYQHWDRLGGRFVSEFGLPSLPDVRTIDFWLDGNTEQRYPQSKLMQQHNKAGSHERRLAIYMNENFRMTGDLESYAYLTQLMQSEGISLAYSLWRREWKGPGKEYNAGTLVWQLNDCWPVSSWAIVDYFYRPKPSFFTIARAMAPITLGIRRTVGKNRENDRPVTFYEYGAFQSREVKVEIWASNFGSDTSATLTVRAMDLHTGWTSIESRKLVTLGENRSTELWTGVCPEPTDPKDIFDKSAPSGSVVIHATVEVAGEVIARMSNWPEPYKLIEPIDPGLSITVDEAGGRVVVRAEKPVKGLWMDVEGDDEGVVWGDNAIDVFPGDEQVIKVTGLKGRAVTASHLGREKKFAV